MHFSYNSSISQSGLAPLDDPIFLNSLHSVGHSVCGVGTTVVLSYSDFFVVSFSVVTLGPTVISGTRTEMFMMTTATGLSVVETVGGFSGDWVVSGDLVG